MKKTKEIPKIIYDMLMDINIDKDFRIAMAKELKIEMPDDHLEDIKNDFDLSMLKEADDSARYEQEAGINDDEPMEDIK